MAIFGRSQSSQKVDEKLIKNNVSVTKSARFRNAAERIHALKKSAGTVAKHLVPASGKVIPRSNGVATSPAVVSSKPETENTERKIRSAPANKQLGQQLLKAGKITKTQLDEALKIRAAKGGLLGQILVKNGACTKSDVAAVVKQQLWLTTVNLSATEFDPEAIAMLDHTFCEQHCVVPFELCGNQLCVAMRNALEPTTKNEIKDKTQQHIKIFEASNSDIIAAIERYYGEQASATAKPSLAEAAKQEEMSAAEDLVIELPDDASDADAENSEEVLDLPAEPSALEDVADISPVASDADDGMPEDVMSPALDNALTNLDSGQDYAAEAEELASLSNISSSSSVAALHAIPIVRDYVREIMVDGFLSREQQWLAGIRGTCPVPAQLLWFKA